MDKCLNCNAAVETIGFRPKKFCNDDCRYAFHNKKKKKWTLKKLAKHYQETGEYLPKAEEAEEIHLMSIAERIEKKYNDYLDLHDSQLIYPEESLDIMIEIEIGHWQVVNGFVRPWKE